MFTRRRFCKALIFFLWAQNVLDLSAGAQVKKSAAATETSPSGFRGRPGRTPITLDDQITNISLPNKPINVQVSPLISQGIAVLSWTDGNLTAGGSINETFQVVCSYDGKCNSTSTMGWSAPPVGRNVGQNYVSGLPVNSTTSNNGYYCSVAVTATDTNQTACSDPILLTQPGKPTSVTSVVQGSNADVWIATWHDGPSANPPETYRAKCVKVGTGCSNTDNSFGFSEWLIPRGVGKTSVVGLPTDTFLDCFIIATNIVGDTCSDAQSIRTGYIQTPTRYCSIIPSNSIIPTVNTAFYTNRVSGVVTQCALVNNAFTTCSIPTASTGLSRPRGIMRYGTSTLFIVNSGASDVIQCTLSGGTISSCSLPTPTGGFNFPNNPQDGVIKDNVMYITMGVAGSLSICTLSGGTIASCSNPSPPPGGWNMLQSYGIVTLGNILYVSDKTNNCIVRCVLSSPGVIASCKILDALSLKAVRHRLDKRKLQEELDLHRLFLITAYHSRLGNNLKNDLPNGNEDIASILDAEAQKLGADGLRSQVSTFLSRQLYDLTTTMHKALTTANVNDDDAGPAKALAALWRRQEAAAAAAASTEGPSTPRLNTKVRGGLGLGFAATSTQTTPPPPPQQQRQQQISFTGNNSNITSTRLSQNQVSNAFLSLSDFTLHVSPSSISHSAAGEGLFIQGQTTIGQIVALYPGIAYSPLYHRHIPGYPLVARSNPFLLSRFDGVVLDAKPWGKGAAESSRRSEIGENNTTDMGAEAGVVNVPQNSAEEALSRLERRNPLALAHYANHPPAGTPPNVMVAPVDWVEDSSLETPATHQPSSSGELRAYVPVINFCLPSTTSVDTNTSTIFKSTSGSTIERAALESEKESLRSHTNKEISEAKEILNFLPRKNDPAPCVALVALRDLKDEELFLNYRLNPNAPGGLPEWYSPVDVEEDARRWA